MPKRCEQCGEPTKRHARAKFCWRCQRERYDASNRNSQRRRQVRVVAARSAA